MGEGLGFGHRVAFMAVGERGRVGIGPGGAGRGRFGTGNVELEFCHVRHVRESRREERDDMWALPEKEILKCPHTLAWLQN